jgi:spermidine synthase
MEGKVSSKALLGIILVEGFVTVSIEILTIRQLMPIIGSSVIITSIIIGIFFLALAYGYRDGSKYIPNFKRILIRNFLASAGLIGIGMAYPVVNLFFHICYSYLKFNNFVTLIAYLLLVTTPIIYLLAQTVPVIMDLTPKRGTVGTASGRILHLSAIGSFLGSILTSILMLNYLGVAWSIFLNCLGLITITLILLLNKNLIKNTYAIILGIGLLASAYIININYEKHNFILSNNYANYNIINDSILVSNNSHSSRINTANKGFDYIEKIKQILFKDLHLINKDILILGAGGFTLSADNTHNFFTYIDIDKDVKKITEERFSKQINDKFIVYDARSFLNNNTHLYDAIVSDTFGDKTNIPEHLLTYEYFNLMRKSLKPDGVVIFNIIANPFLQDNYSKRIDNTIRAAFPACMVIPKKYNNQETNILYACRISTEQELKLPKEIYTDNLNQAVVDRL